MRMGFIGTGSMGSPIALNLLAAGHDLRVHDARRSAATELLAGGAKWRESPADIARDADVILLSLPSQAEVAAVCFGEDGILATVRSGTYLIDLTTVSISLIPRLAETGQTHGVRYLAAPVSQGVDRARAGRLSVFVGGDEQDYEDCRHIFDAVAETVIHTGDQLSAVAAKLLTNLLWFINAAAIGEALVLGVKSGIDLPVLQQVILNSCGSSWVAEHDIPSIYDGSFDPSFTTQLCCKDLKLISELATTLSVPLELGASVEQIFRRALNIYGGTSPELTVVRMMQEQTKTNLQLPDRNAVDPA